MQPQAMMELLSKYVGSVEEVEIREKQLAAMRVDVCSTEALKKLKGARHDAAITLSSAPTLATPSLL